MNFQENFGHLPRFLHPRMRVFLSVDVVGSTGIKQKTGRRKSGPDPYEAKKPPHTVWLVELAGFYGSFSGMFSEEWAKRSQEASRIRLDAVGHPPQLWKTNGDEIIYVKDVKSRAEIALFVSSWIGAIARYRDESAAELDIKATGWCAGFPLLNSEIILDQTPDRKHTKYQNDWILNNLHLLDGWYQGKRDGVIRDYIGPSIDTGFRLCGLSSPRRFSLSVEMAWFLSAQLPYDDDDQNALLQLPPLKFSGEVDLKGVFGEKSYPHFWLDISANKNLSLALDRLSSGATETDQRTQVREFCELFFKQYRQQFPKPFIAGEEGQYNNAPSDSYLHNIQRMADNYEAEKERYPFDGAGSVEDGEPEERGESIKNQASAQDITDKWREIRKPKSGDES